MHARSLGDVAEVCTLDGRAIFATLRHQPREVDDCVDADGSEVGTVVDSRAELTLGEEAELETN